MQLLEKEAMNVKDFLNIPDLNGFNPLMHNVPKWSDTLLKSCSIYCKIFKVCLTILGQYALKS